jgi:hypothetical protein
LRSGVEVAIVVAGFVPARLPEEGHEATAALVAESVEEARRKLEGCFEDHGG